MARTRGVFASGVRWARCALNLTTELPKASVYITCERASSRVASRQQRRCTDDVYKMSNTMIIRPGDPRPTFTSDKLRALGSRLFLVDGANVHDGGPSMTRPSRSRDGPALASSSPTSRHSHRTLRRPTSHARRPSATRGAESIACWNLANQLVPLPYVSVFGRWG